jgi:hypothetical protein
MGWPDTGSVICNKARLHAIVHPASFLEFVKHVACLDLNGAPDRITRLIHETHPFGARRRRFKFVPDEFVEPERVPRKAQIHMADTQNNKGHLKVTFVVWRAR